MAVRTTRSVPTRWRSRDVSRWSSNFYDSSSVGLTRQTDQTDRHRLEARQTDNSMCSATDCALPSGRPERFLGCGIKHHPSHLNRCVLGGMIDCPWIRPVNSKEAATTCQTKDPWLSSDTQARTTERKPPAPTTVEVSPCRPSVASRSSSACSSGS